MQVDVETCGCGACAMRVKVLLRGHYYEFNFRTWRQFACQLISYRDNPQLDWHDLDCFALNYYIGKHYAEGQQCLSNQT